MAKQECSACSLKKACDSSRTSWAFFFIGIIATIALRIIEPIRTLNPEYGKISWYIGVAGFVLFFAYKYKKLRRQSGIIKESRIKEKLGGAEKLTEKDYVLLSEVICSQDNWKERTNFFIIFAVSAAALVIALIIDFAG
jgi:uncharacterized membrane protein